MWGGPPSSGYQPPSSGGYSGTRSISGSNPLLSLLDATKGHILQQSYGSYQGSVTGTAATASSASPAKPQHPQRQFTNQSKAPSGPTSQPSSYGPQQPMPQFGRPPNAAYGQPPMAQVQPQTPVIGPQIPPHMYTARQPTAMRSQPLLNHPSGNQPPQPMAVDVPSPATDVKEGGTPKTGQTKHFVGIVTSKLQLYGFVNEDVFFQDSTVMGGRTPAQGDEVGVTAEYNESLPMKWNAVALCVSRTKQQLLECEQASQHSKQTQAKELAEMRQKDEMLKKAMGDLEQLRQQQALQSSQLAKSLAEQNRLRLEIDTRDGLMKQMEQRHQASQLQTAQTLQDAHMARQAAVDMENQLLSARQQVDAANAQAHALALQRQQQQAQQQPQPQMQPPPNIVQQLFGDAPMHGGGGLLGDGPQARQPQQQQPQGEDRATLQIQRQALMDQVLSEAARSGHFSNHEMQTAERQLVRCLEHGDLPQSPLAKMMLEKMYERMAAASCDGKGGNQMPSLLDQQMQQPQQQLPHGQQPPQPLFDIDTRTARDIVELFGEDGHRRSGGGGPANQHRGGPPANLHRGGNGEARHTTTQHQYSGRSSSPYRQKGKREEGSEKRRGDDSRPSKRSSPPSTKRHRPSSPQPGARIRSPSPGRGAPNRRPQGDRRSMRGGRGGGMRGGGGGRF